MAITSPNDIANLYTWLDAATGVGDPRSELTNQDPLSPATDANLDQASGPLQPALTDHNGIDAVDFDGSTWMASSDSENQTTVTISMVVKIPSTPVDGCLMMHTRVSLLNKPTVAIIDSATTPKLQFGSPFGEAFAIEPDDDWAWGDAIVVTWTWTNSGDAYVARVNGVQKGSGSLAGTSNYGAMTWGANADASSIGTFLGMAIVVYYRILNATELDDLDAYMADTYVVNTPPAPPVDGLLSVAGNRAAEFAEGRQLTVANSTANDGTYTSKGARWRRRANPIALDITDITVEDLVDSTPDGDITTVPGEIDTNVIYSGAPGVGKASGGQGFLEPVPCPPSHSLHIVGSNSEKVDVTIVANLQRKLPGKG